MLGKLFKYEMESQGKSLFLFWIAILGFGLLIRIFKMVEESLSISGYLSAIATFTFVVVTVSSLVYCFFVAIKNFYKKVLREEGYLTNTLPVRKSSIILSFMITDILMLVITVVVSFLGCFIAFGTSTEVVKNIWETISMSLEQEFHMGIEATICILIGSMLLGYLNTISMFYAAMTVGHSFAQNKMASSIGVGVAFYMAMQVLSVIAMGIIFLMNKMDFASSLETNQVPYGLMGVVFGASFILMAISLITTYIFTNRFLNKKLNLE